jgi:hypothetical protein
MNIVTNMELYAVRLADGSRQFVMLHGPIESQSPISIEVFRHDGSIEREEAFVIGRARILSRSIPT